MSPTRAVLFALPMLFAAAAASLLARASDRPVEADADLTLSHATRATTNSIGMTLVLVKAGRFTMGSDKNEPNRRDDEVHLHEVEITKDFWLGAHEVTQK